LMFLHIHNLARSSRRRDDSEELRMLLTSSWMSVGVATTPALPWADALRYRSTE
jgi:hypothetical protein